jgi:hypothetical protein
MSDELPRAVSFWWRDSEDTKRCTAYMARGPDGNYVLLTPVNKWTPERFGIFAEGETQQALAEAVNARLNKSGPWIQRP